MLGSMLEDKRGFASVWRLLAAAAGIVVARSAVTGRFGQGSARMMEALFTRAVARLPQPEHPELLGKLVRFKQVLAQDGTVLQLSPLLKKLFPATRTNSMDAAGKIHATADVVHRRITAVSLKDESGRTLDHQQEGTVSWAAEPDASFVQATHPIAHRVADNYAHLRGKITSEDWSSTITSFLEQHDAARIRGDGRVYWVPPQRVATVKQLGAFLAEVGIDLILCELEPEVRGVVEQVASESIEDQLDKLQAEVVNFDGTQKPSTYQRRLDEYQRLRQRATLYRDALGVGVDRARLVLDELEQKVQSMLDIRRQSTIHKDGTISGPAALASSAPSPSPALEPKEQPASLRFAAANFTPSDSDDPAVLTFVSDDETAKATAQALESMGIAGSWQQAGPVQVNIKNSGPPGAAVSIRLRLPDDLSLDASSSHLAGLGIELLS